MTRQIERQMNLQENTAPDKPTPVNPEASRLLSSGQYLNRPADYLTTTSRLKSILDALQAQQKLLLDARDNSRKSDLNLSLGYTRHGIDSDSSDAHNSSLDQEDYSVALEYRYPLGNRRASGEYYSQMASKRQVEADTKQRMIDAESSLADLQAQESQLVIALKSIDRKIELATQKLVKEKRLYKIGKLDLFELLKDQTAHLESRLQREQLTTRLLTLRLNIGELLDRNLHVYTSIEDAASGE